MRVQTQSRKPCPHCQYLCNSRSKACKSCGRETLFRKHNEEVEKRRKLWLDQSYVKAKKALENNKINVNHIKLSILQQMARLEGAGSASVLLVVGKAPGFQTSLLTYNEIMNTILFEKDSSEKQSYSEMGQQMLDHLKSEYLSERIRRETQDVKKEECGTDNEVSSAECQTMCSLNFMTDSVEDLEVENEHPETEAENLEGTSEDPEHVVEDLEPMVENLEPAVIIQEDADSLALSTTKGKLKMPTKKSATKRKRTRSAPCISTIQKIRASSTVNPQKLPLETQLRYVVPWNYDKQSINQESEERKNEITVKPSVPDIQDSSCYVIVPTDELKNTEAPSRSTITSEEFSLLVRRASREHGGLVSAKDPFRMFSGKRSRIAKETIS